MNILRSGRGSRLLNLEDRLHAYGLEAKQYQMGMSMELWDLPPKLESLGDLTVRRVTCPEELTGFAGVVAANWEPPDPAVFGFYQSATPLLLQDQCPMKLFVGYLDEEAPKADAREEPKGWVKNEKPKLGGVGAPLPQRKERALTLYFAGPGRFADCSWIKMK